MRKGEQYPTHESEYVRGVERKTRVLPIQPGRCNIKLWHVVRQVLADDGLVRRTLRCEAVGTHIRIFRYQVDCG